MRPYAKFKRFKSSDQKREVHAEDHQGDENGCRGETASRPRSSRSHPPLRCCHGANGHPFGCWQRRPGESVVTADRGLAGAFNSSIVRAARKRIRDIQAEGKQVKLYCVGRKARDWLAEYKSVMIGSRTDLAKKITYADAEAIAQEIFAELDKGGIDTITLLFNHFKSVISQVVTFQQLMPLVVEKKADTGAEQPYDYEPSEEEILADLLPRNFAMQLFSALLENNAGFYGSQMNAMENATKNAGEMIKKLTLKYNRTRQANITKELIEIISGAEAI